MGVCQHCSPPWEGKDEDNYCSGCRRPLKRLQISAKTVSITNSADYPGAGMLELSNRSTGADPSLAPVNPVRVRIAGGGAEKLLMIKDEAETRYGVEKDRELVVGPGESVRLDLFPLPGVDSGEHYATLTLETTDPVLKTAEIKIGIAPEPPEVEWVQADNTPIRVDIIGEFHLLVGQAGSTTDSTIAISFRNKGGGYLSLESFMPPQEIADWFTVEHLPSRPLRHDHSTNFQLALVASCLPEDAFQRKIPFVARFSNGQEAVVQILVDQSPPARLQVEPLPPFKLQVDGTYLLEKCPPYSRRDVDIRLKNIGGEPLTIVAIEADPPAALRWYRGGITRLEFGELPGNLRGAMRSSDPAAYGTLSMDLTRLPLDSDYRFTLRFRTEPPEAEGSATFVVQIRRRIFDPIGIPNYIGIDFGTSTSTVAVRDDHARDARHEYRPVMIEEHRAMEIERGDQRGLPSVLFFREVDDPLIGSPAASLAAGQADRYMRSFKRTIGLRCPRKILNEEFTPEDLAEIIFTKLIAQAAEDLEYFTTRIVATCPASFANRQRLSTLRACRRALVRMVLHAHADDLQRILEDLSSAFPDDLGARLQGDPTIGALLRELAKQAGGTRQPAFVREPCRPINALLLLAFLNANRKQLLASGREIWKGTPLSDRDFLRACRTLALQLFEPLENAPQNLFAIPPSKILAEQRGDDLEGTLDRIETLSMELFAAWKLMDVQLLEEPTAAAYAYVLRNRVHFREEMQVGDREHIAVYDFGGGTFDVSIAAITKSPSGVPQVEVIHTDGINEMGGDDLDFAIVENYLDAVKLQDLHRQLVVTSIYELPEKLSRLSLAANTLPVLRDSVLHAKRRLKMMAERDKIALSDDPKLQQVVEEEVFQNPLSPSGDSRLVLTRQRFEALIADRVGETILKFVEVLRAARQKEEAAGREFRLVSIILAGKSSRLPMVRRLMEKYSAQGVSPEKFDTSLKDDEKVCVAIGAAFYGHWRSGRQSQDSVETRTRALPLSVGMIDDDGIGEIFSPIKGLEKGTPIEEYLEKSLNLPYEPVGNRCFAQSSNLHQTDESWDPQEMIRLGTFRWAKYLKDPKPDEKLILSIRVDSNGLVTIAGRIRGELVGGFRETPPGLRDRPGFVLY